MFDQTRSERTFSPITVEGNVHYAYAFRPSAELGKFAEYLGARQLALHHLVPAEPPVERWQAAQIGYSGVFHVGKDLNAINFRA